MAIELLLNFIMSFGRAEAINILNLASKNWVKRYKKSHKWKKLIVETGEFFIKNEQYANLFFKDLELTLSKKNLSKIANDLKKEDGYNLKSKLFNSLMKLMEKYEIPNEIAESYTYRITYTVLEELKNIDSQKYGQYFQKEWRAEEKKCFIELQNRIDKIENDLKIYFKEKLDILSSGEIDMYLKRSTNSPAIGIEFFVIDDDHFKDKFKDLKNNEVVYVSGFNKEETIYCIINELWRLKERRPIYVVKNLDSWNKLQTMGVKDNIYIPNFYADEIVTIENNTNIFVGDENTPRFDKEVLKLRPRTRYTLLKSLERSGLDYESSYSLVSDTNGLYSQLKKKIFKGEYLIRPSWVNELSEKAKKTCLLIGSWQEIEGDKLIIESLYEDSYDKFLEEILPYTKAEDPFLYVVNRRNSIYYYLASYENIWSYIDVLTNEKIWKSFISNLLIVVNESENIFTYNENERIIADLKNEKLFFSETLRRGMLKTLIIKGAYKNDEKIQSSLDQLVEDILNCVKNRKQWIYISNFWIELCEISPNKVIDRMENELIKDTGLLSLFNQKSKDIIFDRNYYINIISGIEELISQKKYFWKSFRILLELDSKKFNDNYFKDTIDKIFCVWMNYSYLKTAEEKIKAAEVALEINYNNTWEYLFSAINNRNFIIGELFTPKYREHCNPQNATYSEMKETALGYLKILLKHMDFSANRWIKMLDYSSKLTKDIRLKVFNQLLEELGQMSDNEKMEVKNTLREIIFKHRYFSSSDWSMSENNILEYEKLLNKIYISTSEYEYVYLFKNGFDYPILYPVPFDKKSWHTENKVLRENLIKDKINEFQKMDYDLTKLAKICSSYDYLTLGMDLAKYWNDGEWDYEVFKKLLKSQKSGQFALDYLDSINNKKLIKFALIIDDLLEDGYSEDIIAIVYRIEAMITKKIPLVNSAKDSIKNIFWRKYIICNACNDLWVISESKKYATLDIYISQIFYINYNRKITVDKIFDCLKDIGTIAISKNNQLACYHAQELISLLQNAYIDDLKKCEIISKIELYLMANNLLELKDMICFQRMFKEFPEILSDIVSVIFGKDKELGLAKYNNKYFQYLIIIYQNANFCPTEKNGIVVEEELDLWIKKYKELLNKNNQGSYFTKTLGRFLAFSPIGEDGYEPCNAVRQMIEKYGDNELINAYESSIYNRRGIYIFSGGKEEIEIANNFKRNAQYLESLYPKTAQIYYDLYERYKYESIQERLDAEIGF
ncbi:hypothetical protein [Anaerococcus vaginalis]|uniref:hypothetical protein n=1 Tax=Anaerococcus vaginalis TaxID=33037 RepID=UPI00290EA924|nr:hypothetical protein [Anaerococcus vaginalis]MDU5460106.1 hypothetical protein [Anaerococcus vaginalis]